MAIDFGCLDQAVICCLRRVLFFHVPFFISGTLSMGNKIQLFDLFIVSFCFHDELLILINQMIGVGK